MTTATSTTLQHNSRRGGQDAELREMRAMIAAPDHWEDSFDFKTVLAGLFVGILMTPASMYMNMIVGPKEMGSAAQWVTIVLFIEVARRSLVTLRRPEVYILYYMAGATLVDGSGLLWNQFMVQSQSMRQMGIAEHIPGWVAPSSRAILASRSLLHREWLAPIGLTVLGLMLQRIDNFGLGYVMYRLTSDVEKLPFPLAPVTAQGVAALADSMTEKATWRWRVFSFGTMLGVLFGAVYIGLPSITGAILSHPLSIFPLPFTDLTTNVDRFIPAVPVILSFNLGLVLMGMILPFWAMVGSFVGLLVVMTSNPILHHMGVLHSWSSGIGAIRTIQSNTLDFYFSFGLGLTAAVAVIGLIPVCKMLLGFRKATAGSSGLDWKALFNPPKGRGDFSIWIALVVYFGVNACTILVTCFLLHHAHLSGLGSPVTKTLMGVLIFYSFVYTPIISYVSARMEGLVGNTVVIPFVREAAFILSGYKGAAIWFAPFPQQNYGAQSLYFRTTELTGTSFRSLIKAEMFIFPIVAIATIVFSQFIWHIAPVPSSSFQYADKMWELTAYQQGLIISSTMPGGEHGQFSEAFRPVYIVVGLGVAMGVYGVLSYFGLPILLVYGLIRGMDQGTPAAILPQFIGALLGRFYFARRFGTNWPQYRVVFFAGYSCGVGLIAMLSLGLVFVSKSVFQSPY